ncbi:n-lysine methyltransferase SMYD2 [Trichonephila inaurata madagascariensis]|uniref:N-lysine methyltransferase SMYD2 n=1 Tax=Trichonephila inaurata madagascariensis TaxID=2747483 RepID=A0A8X6WT52_9ARAC|nr:n-lysine methyltransferase SMYD2 [Trichonephila inaurata madagascariensis]
MSCFQLGELILVSKPYAYVLNNDCRGQRCDYCFQRQSNLKRCSQCSFLYFCDKAYAEEIKQNGKTCQQMIAMIGTIKDYIGPANIPTPSEFIEIFGKVCINTFSIGDNEMQSIGSGIYLGASLFDHSCSPDAEVVFDGTNLHIHAVKHIPHRDISKIYISYIEQLQLTKDRQNALREQYYFLCQCKNCTSSEYNEMMTKLLVSEKEAEQHLGKFKTAFEHIKQMEKNKAGPSSIYSACVQELLSQEKILADTHIYRVKILEYAFNACILNNQWTDAHAMGIQLLKPYRMFYGPYHPTLGIHLYKLAKIQRMLGISSWIVTLQEVETILQVTHGKTHPFYQCLMKILNDSGALPCLSTLSIEE